MKMTAQENAAALRAQGYNCAQAVVGAFGEAYGLEKEKALRAASMLGGGLGGSGECCGAALGMCMALGLACGSAQADPEKKKAQNALVHQAMDIFRQRQGATLCPELKRDKEGCDRIVSEAVKIAQDMLAQQAKSV